MVAMRGDKPRTSMLGGWRKTVNRRNGWRFECSTAPRCWLRQVGASRGKRGLPQCHCPPLHTMLKCANGSGEQENDFGGAGGIVAADSVGGRIARSAAARGAFETRGPPPGGRSGTGGTCGFAWADRG